MRSLFYQIQKGIVMTLVILAAGMGSRYGGLKQIDPITDDGEFILDFSIYDAIRAGFRKVVFVIKEENLALFRETVGKRIESSIEVAYAFQKMDDLPAGHVPPEGRTKPFGTAHAVLAARNEITEPFAVINADDFYGREAYESIAAHLKSAKAGEYCMAGYVLRNTLTENGSVSRGVCSIDGNGYLTDVVERTKISPAGDHAVFTEDGADYPLSYDAIVSMNCWGFTPEILGKIEAGFDRFLSSDVGDPMKREYYLPFSVRECMEAGSCTVRVYETPAKWYGVTYSEDREGVKNGIRGLIDAGIYPKGLWNHKNG